MPRNVRNFWIELEVDGKKTKIATGPVSKGGGFSLTVKMRDRGEIITALEAYGFALEDGTLTLRAYERPTTISGEYADIVVKTQR